MLMCSYIVFTDVHVCYVGTMYFIKIKTVTIILHNQDRAQMSELTIQPDQVYSISECYNSRIVQ